MPAFQYTAIDDNGKEIRGGIEAADPAAAAAELRAQSLHPVDIAEAEENIAAEDETKNVSYSPLSYLKPVRGRDLVFFFRQMASMIRAGMTLLQALDVTRSQCSNPRLAAAINRISLAITAGAGLSKAIGDEKRYFPAFSAKLVEAAEASGEIDLILDRIADQIEARMETKSKMITGLIYPSIVVLLSIGVVTFLVVFVIPKLERFFSRRQVALPSSTRALLDFAGFVQNYGIYILAVLAASVVALIAAKRSAKFGLSVDRAFLSLPVVGNLLVAATMAQICKAMATLLTSGVTLLESLRIVSNIAGNKALTVRFNRAIDGVLGGSGLAGSLHCAVIPKFVSRMVDVGEHTGSLDIIFNEISAYYDKDLQTRIRRMDALFEPVIILVIGCVVGFVYFAFFQALFQIARAG